MLFFSISASACMDDGDRAFMENVYLAHRKLMYRVAFRIMRDHEDTEDIIGTACEKLCEKISLLRTLDDCKLRAYVVLTCKNTALNMLKKRNWRNERLFFDMDAVSETVAGDDNVEDDILREAEIDMLEEALDALNDRERDILQMKYLFGQTDGEIAAVYGIKASSVRYYLTLARRRLAAIMKEKERL